MCLPHRVRRMQWGRREPLRAALCSKRAVDIWDRLLSFPELKRVFFPTWLSVSRPRVPDSTAGALLVHVPLDKPLGAWLFPPGSDDCPPCGPHARAHGPPPAAPAFGVGPPFPRLLGVHPPADAQRGCRGARVPKNAVTLSSLGVWLAEPQVRKPSRHLEAVTPAPRTAAQESSAVPIPGPFPGPAFSLEALCVSPSLSHVES